MTYMIRAVTQDLSKGWIMDVPKGISPEDAQKYCVQSADWQVIRLSMKDKNTTVKLQILLNWWETNTLVNDGVTPLSTKLQVWNYLGALRRGGQLDVNNMIRKVR